MSSSPDHYATLQLPPFASSDDVKAAYHAQMKQHHPDHNIGRAQEAERRAVQIIEAFRVLGDPQRRAHYDAERHRAAERFRSPPRVRRAKAVTPAPTRHNEGTAGEGRAASPRRAARPARVSSSKAAGARARDPRRCFRGVVIGAALGLGTLAAAAVVFAASQPPGITYPASGEEPTLLQKQVADLRSRLITDPEPPESPPRFNACAALLKRPPRWRERIALSPTYLRADPCGAAYRSRCRRAKPAKSLLRTGGARRGSRLARSGLVARPLVVNRRRSSPGRCA